MLNLRRGPGAYALSQTQGHLQGFCCATKSAFVLFGKTALLPLKGANQGSSTSANPALGEGPGFFPALSEAY